jgi:signal transduction histidine kinase
MTGRLRCASAAVLVGATCGLAGPTPSALREPVRFVEAPLDPALRVPHASVLLGWGNAGVEPGERVLEVRVPPQARSRAPRGRYELYGAIRGGAERELALHVARGSERRWLTLPIVLESPLDRLWRAWPLPLAAAAFLAFGLIVAAGSPHPSAAPLFAVSWCLGSALLGELDRVLPETLGWIGGRTGRARVATAAWTLLPAAFLHLAMRFPVVSPRFRAPWAAALPYACWLLPAAIAQLRLHDPAFQGAIERIALGSSIAGATLLAVATATAARRLKPIERARTGALLGGLCVGGAGPAAQLASGGNAPAASVLSLLALPGLLAWAIIRYRLLDPTLRFQRALLGAASRLLAPLLAAAGVAGGLSLLGVGFDGARRAAAAGLLAAVVTQLLQGIFRRTAAARVLADRSEDRLLERAARELAEGRTPEEILRRASSCVRDGLGDAPVCSVRLGSDEALASGGLPASGIALWRAAGSPPRAVIRAGARTEDPSPEHAELVVALLAEPGPAALLVVGARVSGLPYTDSEARLLEGLRHVATTALGAAASAADLEQRVREKTADLERGLRDRQRVLEAAEGLCGADEAEEVLERLAAFAGDEGRVARWCDVAPARAALAGRVQAPGEAPRILAVDGLSTSRARELAPQLDALCAFAGIALGRLALLAELKREVERQAAELAEIRSRRLHAEFVRGVAHELRKPVEELRQRAERLPELPSVSLDRARLCALGRELARRLDLLLFHSGIRLDRRRTDLASLADEAVEAARAVAPGRDFWVFHEPPALPVLGDPSRLLSVVENLLDNAVKATQPGQRITLRSRLERARAGTGPRAVIEVEDEGEGIDADRASQIFEPGVAFTPGGFGLGLSFCREIVCLHGGTIELESRPGRTLFRLRIPLFASGDPASDRRA